MPSAITASSVRMMPIIVFSLPGKYEYIPILEAAAYKIARRSSGLGLHDKPDDGSEHSQSGDKHGDDDASGDDVERSKQSVHNCILLCISLCVSCIHHSRTRHVVKHYFLIFGNGTAYNEIGQFGQSSKAFNEHSTPRGLQERC